jgi:4-hydroxy-tetrahydrodipicolinate synthase
METCRETYFKYFPLLESLYQLSNPIVIKAALKILGLPGGHLRKPYSDFVGPKFDELKKLMGELGVLEKYGNGK